MPGSQFWRFAFPFPAQPPLISEESLTSLEPTG
jgi:hypothetical protein